MQVHILSNEQAVSFLRTMSGKTEADDLRSKIVQSENLIQKAIHYHHTASIRISTSGTWWQVVMGDSLQAAEAAMIAAEARLAEMGEPRSTWADDKARERCGFFPYRGRMAHYMAQHLGSVG